MRHGIIARFSDGETLKGYTEDLFPGKDSFHLEPATGGERRQVAMSELKAVFFVKSFEGNARRDDQKEGERAGYGKKIRVVFKDGEEIVGYTSGYSPGRAVFFVFPIDPESNNDRILVVTSAAAQIEFV